MSGYQYNGHAAALNEEIVQLESKLSGVVWGREHMEARLARLQDALEREVSRERGLARRVAIASQVMDKRTAEIAHIRSLHSLCAEIRAKYQDPPGAGAERMRIILAEIDAGRNRRKNSSGVKL